MDFLNRCLAYIKNTDRNVVLKSVEEVKGVEYKAAGCLFTDGNYVLAGVQRKNRCISGFGGVRIDGETYIQTALRELVEELFEIHDLNPTAYEELALVVVSKTLFDNGYINLVYSFKDLELFLRILEKYEACVNSKMYIAFPLSINELIFGRSPLESSEISYLALLPIIDYDKRVGYIDPVFFNDMASVVADPTKHIGENT